MFPVCRITGLDRERRIGGPFASPVPSMAIYAAGTDHTGDADTETDDNHQQKPRWKGLNQSLRAIREHGRRT